MQINRIDHLVITVADIERTVDFYQRVLAMQRIEFAAGRVALRCGAQGVAIIDGPVERSGANGTIISLYLRDPDSNLIEISNYLNDEDNA